MKQALLSFFCLFLSTNFSQGQTLIDTVRAIRALQGPDAIPYKELHYFPSTPPQGSSTNVRLNEHYANVLSVLNEPVIYRDQSSKIIYRFIWVRAFHAPVVIRLESYIGKYQLIWKAYDKAPGSRLLDKKTWDRFINQLTRINFWQLPTEEQVLGVDGSRWILEGKLPDQYHVVDRFMPKVGTGFYECCDFLIGLTGLKFTEEEKY